MSALRVILWGPGWVGGPALRRAYADPAFDVVGVKVFDPAKHGKDAGELVGIGPIGVRATTSRQEILDLDADCVIFTPHASAVYEGIDEDVIDLLESGKNVVTTAAYHNPTMPNWHNTAVTPMQRMREFSRMTGAAQSPAAQRALQAMRSLTDGDRFDRVGNRALQAFTDRRFRCARRPSGSLPPADAEMSPSMARACIRVTWCSASSCECASRCRESTIFASSTPATSLVCPRGDGAA